MAGQVAYHLMAQAGMTRAPWAVTTVVSCLPVLVLGMGTALAHMLRADTEVTEVPDSEAGPPATARSLAWSPRDQARPDRVRPEAGQDRSEVRDHNGQTPGPRAGAGVTGPGICGTQPQVDRARGVARRLAAAGKPVSRRALRSGGVTGSNEALNVLARILNSELAGVAPPGAPAGGGTGLPGLERIGHYSQSGNRLESSGHGTSTGWGTSMASVAVIRVLLRAIRARSQMLAGADH